MRFEYDERIAQDSHPLAMFLSSQVHSNTFLDIFLRLLF